MSVGEAMNLQQWQERVGALRATDPLIKRGRWHGCLLAGVPDGAPIHGTYALVRWELPSISVAHEDPDEAVRLAQLIEDGFRTEDEQVEQGRTPFGEESPA
jgi:hypothetical protein